MRGAWFGALTLWLIVLAVIWLRSGRGTPLDGTWQAVEGVIDGWTIPEAELARTQRRLGDGQFEAWRDGVLSYHGLFRLDSSAAPPAVDFWIEDQYNGGLLLHGVYRLEGERLLTCVAKPGAARPDDFTAPPGSGRTLVVWRRAR